jgi:hypothetical protein
MLAAVLFFTQRGLHSPAQWAVQCQDSLTARWLLRGILPCRARWYAFRKRCSGLIDELNRQLLHLAVEARLLDPDVAVFDGTFIAANSSRHVLLNGPRLRRRLLALHAAIAADDAPPPQPQRQDQQQAAAPPGWMARTKAGRLRQRRRYLKAAGRLCRRLERNRKRRKEDRKPDDKVLISLGDPEAVLGLDKEKVYRPLYNVQLVSDLKTDFCTGYGAFASTPDAETFVPMLSRVGYFTGRQVRRAMTDSGYASGANLREAERQEVELIAPYQENDYSKKGAEGKQKQIPKGEFSWDKEKRVYVCPQGKELVHVKSQTRQRGAAPEAAILPVRGGALPRLPEAEGLHQERGGGQDGGEGGVRGGGGKAQGADVEGGSEGVVQEEEGADREADRRRQGAPETAEAVDAGPGRRERASGAAGAGQQRGHLRQPAARPRRGGGPRPGGRPAVRRCRRAATGL